jgi:hypothetical protein
LLNWVVSRTGAVRNLHINVITNTLLATATYTVRRSPACNGAFAPTALAITVGAGVTGCFTNGSSQAVAPSDRISLEVTTGGLVGVILATGGLEVA